VIKFIEATLTAVFQTLILAVFFGTLTAAIIGLARLIEFLAAL
jgi:hypothetical protein